MWEPGAPLTVINRGKRPAAANGSVNLGRTKNPPGGCPAGL